MKKIDWKTVGIAVIATVGVMYAIHNVSALESVRHATGLDD